MSIAFLLATLVVAATPGTGVVFTLSAALSRGRRAGVVAAVGCTLALVPHLVAVGTGLAALLHASPTAFDVVRYLGVGYLLYLAWVTARDRSGFAAAADPVARPAHRVITSAVLVNLLNPKPMLFLLAFLPQFVPAGGPNSTGRMLLHGAVFMLVTFVVFAAYGVLASAVRRRVLARPRLTERIRHAFAGSFVVLGLSLLFVER
ncbi:LysE family translocator [Micromonospora sp. KC606]|uniref:LysE family translocator n=1 Tax=Micromonospora sp. KC606 TaxID=2530379 RepID=UPI0010435988|nr:LysE family translocator [Micromonospora sp. KC606]TDC81565.1 LysE family translocator [Micromonospora sp. KC606]